jgi:ATP-binding cassette subfamily B protein
MSMKYFIRIFETGGPDIFSRSLSLAVLLFLISIGLRAVVFVQEYLYDYVKGKSTQNISADLHDYVYGQSFHYYSDRMPGTVASQIGTISGGLVKIFIEFFGDFLGFLLGMLASFGLIFAIDSRVAILVIIGTVLRMIWSIAILRPQFRASKETSRQSSILAGKLLDSLSNFSIVKLFAGKRKEIAAAAPEREKLIEKQMKESKWNNLSWAIPRFVETIVLYSAFLLCAYLFVLGEIRISDIAFAVSSLDVINENINQLFWKSQDVLDAYAAASEAYNRLMAPVEIKDDENAPDLIVKKGEIKIKNVSFNYGNDDVLKNFSLDIKPGEHVGLVGLSGGGKTTLASLLMRLYEPQSGRIEIDRQDIRHVTQESLRRQISFIPQDAVLFHRSLKDNIAYGKDNAVMAEITDAAKKADAHDFIMRTPKKYNSLVGDRGIKLSGGQRQRIAIARAILKNAPILIMDEATSSLDSETEAVVQKSFDMASKERTTMVIAHRLSTLRHMNRIVVFRDGRIYEIGTHAELLKKGDEYARLWKIQSDGFIA